MDEDGTIHAIKKFKPDKEGDVVTYTGISQSAIREIAVRDYIHLIQRTSFNMLSAEQGTISRKCRGAERGYP